MLCLGDIWEEVIDIIKKWLVNNNLFLNIEKTCIVPHALVENTLPTESKIKFHNNNCLQLNNCSCESMAITNNSKYLGIEIGSNMKWKDQINTENTEKNDLCF